MPVRVWRRPWFRFTDETADRSHVLALLDVASLPGELDQEVLVRWMQEGGGLFLAGMNGVEECLGYTVRPTHPAVTDSLAVTTGGEPLALPPPRAVLQRVDSDEAEREGRCRLDPLPVGSFADVRSLAVTADERPIAVRLEHRGGGWAIIVADGRYVTNEALRETDAGLAIVPWVLAQGSRAVVVDEYHQGEGESGSLLGAAWQWARATPPGWALLQLGLAALVVLLATAVRFGPMRRTTHHRRRSSLEHMEALAAGLERGDGERVAVELLTAGLRRRLGATRPAADGQGWLESLALAARNDEAREAVRRFGRLLGERGDRERVLRVAQAVEDVWNALA